MDNNQSIQQLDDQTVLDILSYLTENLRDEMPDSNRNAIKNSDEANAAIIEFLKINQVLVNADTNNLIIQPEQSRDVLQMLWNDEDVRPKVEELIAHPPIRSQRSIETAMAAAVVLGMLITWLQTKVEIRISRKDGEISYEFVLVKPKSSDKLIKEVVNPVSSMLTKNKSK